MLHRQLRNALEEIFGTDFLENALNECETAERVLSQRPADFKKAIIAFGSLNYRDEHTEFVNTIDHDLQTALICSLLDTRTRQLVKDLGLNYL